METNISWPWNVSKLDSGKWVISSNISKVKLEHVLSFLFTQPHSSYTSLPSGTHIRLDFFIKTAPWRSLQSLNGELFLQGESWFWSKIWAFLVSGARPQIWALDLPGLLPINLLLGALPLEYNSSYIQVSITSHWEQSYLFTWNLAQCWKAHTKRHSFEWHLTQNAILSNFF